MSAATIELIEAFERLPGTEREEFFVELARRRRPGNAAADLRTCGIGETQTTDLRARLKTFAEDRDRADMAIYDENQPR